MSGTVKHEERESAFKCRLRTIAIINDGNIDLTTFFQNAFADFETKLKETLKEHLTLKVNLCLKLAYQKLSHDKISYTEQEFNINTKNEVIDNFTNLNEFYEIGVVQFIKNRVDDIALRGSGFTLRSINEMIINLNKFDPIKSSSFIKLPAFLANKKAIINVQNPDDEECFKWAILSSIHHKAAGKQHLVSRYRFAANELKFDGISFPVSVNDIVKFEQQNVEISINVYIFDAKERTICPYRLTKEIRTKHIHLLMLTEPLTEDTENRSGSGGQQSPKIKTHYCWIKDLSKLTSMQVSKNKGKFHLCDRCLNHFYNKTALDNHQAVCFKENFCQIEMPTEEKKFIQFKNFKNQLEVPYIIYADIETLLQKPDQNIGEGTSQGTSQASKTHQHIPYSIGYYIKCTFDDSKSVYASKRGPKCIEWFMGELKDRAYEFVNILKNDVGFVEMTREQQRKFKEATKCHICEIEFLPTDKRHRDHSHLTGEYRGAAHDTCNQHFRASKRIPVVFHNLSAYDAHFLLPQLVSELIDGNVTVIANTMENYITIQKTVNNSAYSDQIRFQFIDSYRFMAESLDKLSSILESNKKTILYSEFSKTYKQMRPKDFELLERKGILPYEYLDSFEKFNERALPSQATFYNRMLKEDITDDEYKRAHDIWKMFNIKTLGEYTDLYLKTDVLLLADVFENFRAIAFEVHKLDPAHYVSVPSFSWDAMLKKTKVRLELLTDVDQLMFVEKGNGGIFLSSEINAQLTNCKKSFRKTWWNFAMLKTIYRSQ